jgi:hypothetical protein
MSMRLVLSIAVVAGLSVVPAVESNAQTATRCGPRTEVLKALSSQYKEAPVAVGVASNGRLLEVLSAKDGSTWTALVTSTDGTSCMVMSGESWQSAPRQMLVGQPL